MNIKNIRKKGLRYFSQMFDEEEQQNEIQIGLPTDVKHVAHIGWDGPSTNAPSWMNDFKPQSVPSDGSVAVDPSNNTEDEEDKGGKGANAASSSTRETPGLPKPARARHPSMDSLASVDDNDSMAGSPTSQGRSIKVGRRRKDKSSSKQKEKAGPGDEAEGQTAPNIPKKSRKKTSKRGGSRGGSIQEDGSIRSTSELGAMEED